MPVSHSVGLACFVASHPSTRVPAKSANDGCGDGMLQEDGRELPNGHRTTPLLQDHRNPAAHGFDPADLGFSALLRGRC
jgi:hypothetical protein